MNRQQFWQLIEAARDQTSNPDDGEEVARRATSELAWLADRAGTRDLRTHRR
ncbi:hypothetical protein [Streptomyces sp. NPDC002779]|uniref:hypothetical protein n=1 Tax=Streptomyces sp. NPDC002779 TaxID=3364664 RepID=UPI0036B21A25